MGCKVGLERCVIKREILNQMSPAFCSALGRAACEENHLGRAARQIQLFESGGRNGRDLSVGLNRIGRRPAFQTEFSVREILPELIFKDTQSQEFEPAVLRGFDEVCDLIEQRFPHATPNSCRIARVPITTVLSFSFASSTVLVLSP